MKPIDPNQLEEGKLALVIVDYVEDLGLNEKWHSNMLRSEACFPTDRLIDTSVAVMGILKPEIDGEGNLRLFDKNQVFGGSIRALDYESQYFSINDKDSDEIGRIKELVDSDPFKQGPLKIQKQLLGLTYNIEVENRENLERIESRHFDLEKLVFPVGINSRIKFIRIFSGDNSILEEFLSDKGNLSKDQDNLLKILQTFSNINYHPSTTFIQKVDKQFQKDIHGLGSLDVDMKENGNELIGLDNFLKRFGLYERFLDFDRIISEKRHPGYEITINPRVLVEHVRSVLRDSTEKEKLKSKN